MSKNPKKYSESKIKEICEFYVRNKSLRKTSEFFDIPAGTIYNYLKGNNIDTKRDINQLRLNKNKSGINESFFEKIDTSEKAYVLGWIFSDGTMCSNVKQVRLRITDLDILSTINNLLEREKSLLDYKKERSHHKESKQLIICNAKIYEDLLKLGCKPRKSYDCELPNIDFNLMPDFIRGFFDGDGSVHINKYNRAEIKIMSTFEFCEQLKDFFEKCGIRSHVRYDKQCDQRIRYLEIKAIEDCVNFYYLIYRDSNNLFLKRKFEKFSLFIDSRNLRK